MGAQTGRLQVEKAIECVRTGVGKQVPPAHVQPGHDHGGSRRGERQIDCRCSDRPVWRDDGRGDASSFKESLLEKYGLLEEEHGNAA
jgi:hypothetical protein